MFGLRALGALPYTGRPETAVSGAIKWYLNVVSPPNGYMTLKTPLDNIDYGLAQYAIEFKITVSASGVNLLGVNAPALATANSIGFTNGGRFQIGAGGSTYLFTNTNAYILDGLPHVYRFEHDANGAWRFYRDGTLFQSGVKSTSVTPSAPIGTLFAIGTTMTGANCQFYYLAVEGFGAGSGVWDADKSGGVGNKLLSSSGNDATQAGTWSNSGWVPYLDSSVSNALVPQPVSGAIKWYLKWPATTGTNNKALVQLSGIGMSSYLTLVFAEDVIDPNTTGVGAYLCDGRRALNTTDEGNGTYFLEYNNFIETNGATNFTLNGASSTNNAWRTAKAGDAYKFFFDAGLDGVVSVGGRFNQIDGFPLLALKTIIVDDANGSHVIDLTNKAGLTQFTSNDGLIAARLFGFNEGSCWCPYLDTTVSTPIVNQGVNGTAKSGLDFAGNTTTLQRRIAPFPLPTNYTQDMRIDVTFVHATSSDYQAMLQTPEYYASVKNFFVGCASSGEFYFWNGGTTHWSGVTPIAGQEYVISITVDTAKNVGISVNGSPYLYKSYPNLSAALYDQIHCGGTTNNAGAFKDPFVGRLKRVETWVGGVKTGDYTNETGAGTTMVNTIGGAVATQAGTWPIDNSEWRQYIVSSGPSGQASSTLNISFKKFDLAASFQNIKPTSSTALDMAFKKFVVNSSLQSLPPQSQTTVAMTFNQFAVLVSGETTKPVFNSTANINFKKFGILVDGSSGKPTSSITISSTFKKFNAAITGQSVKPTSSVDANITFKKFAISSSGESVRPQTNATVTTVFKKFSVASSLEFTKPVFNTAIAATFKSFNVAASIDSDVPLFNTSISITMPAFGVSVIMGDVKFFGSDGTHYEHEALSTASQYEAGSTLDYTPYFSTHTEWRL